MASSQLRVTATCTSGEDEEILVLLSRHIVDTRKTSDFMALKVQLEDEVLDVSTASHHTDHAISTKISGSFTNKNAGGNPTYPSFMFNPQYHLHIPKQAMVKKKAHVAIAMEGSRELPMQIMVVWSVGQRITELSGKDIVATSGPYTYGLARIVAQLSPGDYNIVVSAFEPRHTGDFKLDISSDLRLNVTNILQEGAGMFSKSVRDAWTGTSAAGAPSFDRYFENPIFEISLLSQAKVQVRLQLDQSQSSYPLNVSIYSATRAISTAEHVATSGGYSDALSGVITPLVHLPKGKYWIVPSTYNPEKEAPFRLIVYSTVSLEPRRVARTG
ncbi:cysteine protease [Marasmius crinis-equi]|uniref:Cysteine protease n=1 Tax=Marasmius crinis-equi TaxID=585013 RepID=A0ABR3FQQ9_9AGAR